MKKCLSRNFEEIYWFLSQNSHNKYKYIDVKKAFNKAFDMADKLKEDEKVQRMFNAIKSMKTEWVMRFPSAPVISNCKKAFENNR